MYTNASDPELVAEIDAALAETDPDEWVPFEEVQRELAERRREDG
jgi:hypothetical protein